MYVHACIKLSVTLHIELRKVQIIIKLTCNEKKEKVCVLVFASVIFLLSRSASLTIVLCVAPIFCFQ